MIEKLPPELLRVRTGLRAGQEIEWLDALLFPILDALQKPTDLLYQHMNGQSSFNDKEEA